MDAIFLEGLGATISAIIVFCGSVFLLIALIVGARLAYFITASITLAFVLMMGLVWSGFKLPFIPPTVNPLGPVGELPSWSPVGIAEDPSAIDFGPVSSYPEGDWVAPDPEVEAEATKASGVKNTAADALEQAIIDGDIDAYTSAGDAQAIDESIRLLQQGDQEYGAVTLEPVPGAEGPELVAVLEYDPGNPLGTARVMTGGVLVLLALHLFALSRIEQRARAEAAAKAETSA